jgi:indolepyruvate decarboxylase
LSIVNALAGAYAEQVPIIDGPYNDIQPWKYHLMPQIFGESWSTEVRTESELELALVHTESHTDKLCFIEIHLDRFDCCDRLAHLTQTLQ